MERGFCEEEAREAIGRARKALLRASAALEEGDFCEALSRAYFSMFYAALSAFVVLGERPRSHRGSSILVGERLVAEGIVSPEAGRAFSRALQDRIKADYDLLFKPTKEQAEARVEEARKFVAEIEKFLREKGVLDRP